MTKVTRLVGATCDKPPALGKGGTVRVISPASYVDQNALSRGIEELERYGYRVLPSMPMEPNGYFAGQQADRFAQLEQALLESESDAVICARGGYGSAELLDRLDFENSQNGEELAPDARPESPDSARLRPKLIIGYSDVTVLQVYVWQRLGWTSIYGPMVAAGFDRGAGQPDGYDQRSFLNATGGEAGIVDIPLQGFSGWSTALGGEAITSGTASGRLLGGCLTLLQSTLGTPWELDTRDSILLLEDRGVKPYQLDRMLLHLAQAGKFHGVRGILLGEFPECEATQGSEVTVWDVCRRRLGPLGIPVLFGAAVGHTPRPMLTLPLGVRVCLQSIGEGNLDILESAVMLQRDAAS